METRNWLDNPFIWWMDNEKPDLGSFYVGLGYRMPLMPLLYEAAYQLDKVDEEQARVAESGIYLMAAALVAKHLEKSDELGTELMAQMVNNNADSWLQDILKGEGNEYS